MVHRLVDFKKLRKIFVNFPGGNTFLFTRNNESIFCGGYFREITKILLGISKIFSGSYESIDRRFFNAIFKKIFIRSILSRNSWILEDVFISSAISKDTCSEVLYN